MFAIIIWIILFMTLVLIHELWHFISAKKSWVKVHEFGIGIPPKLFTLFKDKDWTEYTVNLLPLWWFVRLKWEDPTNPDDLNSKDSFLSAKLWKKLIILFGWVTMNLIFAWILFSLAFMNWVKPINIMPENMLWMKLESESYLMPSLKFAKENNLIKGWQDAIKTLVLYVQTWSTAEKIWIKENDLITSVNNTEINWFQFVPDYLKINNLCWQEITVWIKRWTENLNLIWKIPTDWCKLWIYPVPDIKKTDINELKMNPINAMWSAIWEIKAESILTFKMLWNIWSNLLSFNKEKIKSSVEKMSWPVWAVKVWEIIIKEYWFWQYLAFGAMISLALALFNVLPLPALDWWRAFSILIQAITKAKAEVYFKIENYLNLTFFILLLGLWVYIILLDLVRFWWINIPWISW